jgi:hypothetical protein
MAVQRTLKIADDVFAEFNTLKIRLAGSLGHIPTNGELVGAMAMVGNEHYGELVTALTRNAE